MAKQYILAYDLERTGSPAGCRVIAIGASVVNAAFEEVGTFRAACFKPNEALFEWACIKEFWLGQELKDLAAYKNGGCTIWRESSLMDLLTRLEKETPAECRTQAEAEAAAFNKFVAFCQYWDRKAREEGATLLRCSDNVAFDTHWVNKLLAAYRPDLPPLPYNWVTGKYDKHYDVHQVQLGFLSAQQDGRALLDYWGCGKAMELLYKVPPKVKQHTHMPDDDAYTTAFDLAVVLAAAQGRLQKQTK
jgi:hypothetical protein